MGKSSVFIVTGVLILGAAANAGIINGSFETGDTTGWSTAGDVMVTQSYDANLYPYHHVEPVDGAYHAILTAGAVESASLGEMLGVSFDSSYTYGSAIYQNINADAGDTLAFSYNFLGNDYAPFYDAAFFTVSGETPELLADISEVDSFGSTSYRWFEHTFAWAGTYTIGFSVFNQIDNGLSSQLALDGAPSIRQLSLESVATPEPSTLALSGGALLAASFLLKKVKISRRG